MIKRLPIYLLLTALGTGAVSGAYAIDIKDDVYQIATASDLMEFSNLVSGGSSNIRGVLTNDVDMSGV